MAPLNQAHHPLSVLTARAGSSISDYFILHPYSPALFRVARESVMMGTEREQLKHRSASSQRQSLPLMCLDFERDAFSVLDV